LQISAAGRNYRYEIRMEVKGPTETAAVTFSSTPPLTSEQILLMLTAGEMPDTDYTFTAGARAGRLATFLGRDLLSRYLGNEGAEERLIIRSGEDVSEEGRLTYSVEYRLSERWSVIGEYDEYNAFNTDLKWKVFAR
jgi:translocation and assembly module TamB